MRFGGWLLILAATACVHSNQVECGDGVVCPAGYTCVPQGCASPDQIKACNPLPDDGVCSIPLGEGRCVDGLCIVAICGNSIMELDEVCDDGNTVSGDSCSGKCNSLEVCGNGIVELAEECDGGTACSESCKRQYCGNSIVDPGEVCDDGNEEVADGCSVGCRSDETCGNGITDYGVGEQCDDSNAISNDGCSKLCGLEPQLWLAHQPVGALARVSPVMAYDAARRRTILFGGTTTTYTSQETFEWDGAGWIRMTPIDSPPPRHSAAMAYDAKRARIVMFGGQIGAGLYNDTWEYDGITWKQRPVTAGDPPHRTGHAMVYDGARERIVMYGGFNGARLGDLWEYDGTTWTRVSFAANAVKPEARQDHAMAYDAKRDVIVMYGGTPQNALNNNETWEYANGAWTQRNVTGPGGGRSHHTIAYDGARGVVVMYGGDVLGIAQGSTWEYNGVWYQSGSHSPTRSNHAMAYDVHRARIVVAGGDAAGGAVVETAERDSAGWHVVGTTTPVTAPSPRRGHAAVFDAARGRTVLFGGIINNALLPAETWEFTGLNWRRATPDAQPTARHLHALAYDNDRRKVILFGGDNNGGVLDDTWEYDGETWAQPSTITTKPQPRRGHALAYDIKRRKLVLFGGNDGTATGFFADTWEFDGSTWTLIAATTPPPARAYHGMVYDISRGKVVLVGGASDTVVYNETWEYDGSGWTQRVLVNAPPARVQHGIAYDVGRQRVVLFGGALSSVPANFDSTALDDLWELDGTRWNAFQPVALLPAPSARRGVTLVYEPTKQQMLLFGGSSGVTTNESWMFGYPDILVGEACSGAVDYDGDGAVGCADGDCWGTCSPLCSPSSQVASCPASPVCGDDVCGLAEDCRSCPADCTTADPGCPVRCGDFICDSPETATSCPGDC